VIRSNLTLGLTAAMLRLGLYSTAQRSSRPVEAAPPARSAGFKITFGVKQKLHGRSWAGVLQDPAQVRSMRGWHLDTGDTITPPTKWNIALRSVGPDTPAKGVVLEVVSPPDRPVTVYTREGNYSFTPSQIPYGTVYEIPETNGDATVERVPLARPVSGPEFEDDDPAILKTRGGDYWMAWVAYRTIARKDPYIEGGDQILVARSADGESWGRPAPLTPPGDHFRAALAEDGRGRIWCVYGAQKKMETGGFDLYARVYDGRTWSAEQPLTSDPRPDIFHRLVSDRKGNLYLAWMGFRPGPGGGPAQSDILMRVWNGERWGEETNVSQSAENDWEPALAADSSGRVWIAWDSYRSLSGPASYDLLLRSYAGGSLGPVRAVSETPLAEMRADVAVDASDRVWIAWEEGGANWGKDSGYENPKHRIHLRPGGSEIYGPANSRTYNYRRPRVAVLEGDTLKQPAADLSTAYPPGLQGNLFQNPRLGVDGAGRVWVFLRNQLVARGRNAGHLFDFYATVLRGEGESQKWMRATLLPASTGRQDTVLASAPGRAGAIVVAAVGDGRRLPVPLPVNHDVAALTLDAGAGEVTPRLKPFAPSAAGPFAATHPDEAAQVSRIRNHRLHLGGASYKIVRGDLHRHTEISMDGAIDGSLWDLYRYSIDAAAFDYIAVTDHNYGAWLDTDEPESKNTDDVFEWWRTQKSADLFYVPGRFTPLYGYERSINFPLGHRNILHTRRGVFSLRVPKLYVAERAELVERDARNLWAYLRATGGVGLPHTSGTSMGTDWRLRDDALEPVTEIYQGDRNSYEEEGGPRAALASSFGPGSSGRPPYQKGLVWNALGAGYRMGFIASSDHSSTHISYANILTPDRPTTRADIQQAIRQRHTYASTDNIVVDFHAGEVLQGGAMQASESPTFQVSVQGTAPILRIEVIKNNRVVYTRPGGPSELGFTFRDGSEPGGDFNETSMGETSQIKNWGKPETGIRPRPSSPESYYYIRVIQSFSAAQPEAEGEVAWSSPIFVRR
jgi:hypothetical protein